MGTNPETTVIPAGEGTVALHIPAELADATIGGTSIVNLTSGWADRLCPCHNGHTAPDGGYLVCRLNKVDGVASHVVENVFDGRPSYSDALAAKYAKKDGEYRLIYSAYACGHYVY